MSDDEKASNITDLKELKKKIKEELKKEILGEIYKELKSEEKEHIEKIASLPANKVRTIETSLEKPAPLESKATETIRISVKTILKLASHAVKYANSNIPQEKWVEVIGLLAGKLDQDGITLHIEDAFPMGHGNAIYAEIKDYKNYVRAFNDIKSKSLFICGWYHSHPSYGLFMSTEDFGTQSRYQKLWEKSIALVVDPYLINGTSFGFNVFRADLKSKKWFAVPFKIKGTITANILPELLEFINPITEGKAIYLEYDE